VPAESKILHSARTNASATPRAAATPPSRADAVEWRRRSRLSSPPDSPRVDVATVMADLQGRVRAQVRERLAAGSPEFRDPKIFDEVSRVFRRGLDRRDRGELLLPELLPDEEEWRVDTPLRLSTHRPVIGGAFLFLKRRILLPLNRWLYEYTREHFRRQHQVNLVLFACLESLAIENARLRHEIDALRSAAPAPLPGAPPGAPRPPR
jgi:hypothetical protein